MFFYERVLPSWNNNSISHLWWFIYLFHTKPKSTQSQFTNQWSANFVGIVELSALCPVNVIIDKRCATITLIVRFIVTMSERLILS